MEQLIPKVFISYAWSQDNLKRVLELSESLMSDGVQVILDKWDLKEGQDKYAFMEQSVNDKEINKVLIICDKRYYEKANAREGGVGDETVIISPEVYGKVNQEKFIPIIFEKDDNNEPYTPKYMKSRIYIDLSDDKEYEVNYEQLLRNIFNEPLYRKPALGKKPEWLNNEQIDFSKLRSILKQLNSYSSTSSTKLELLVKKFNEEFIQSLIDFTINNNIKNEDNLLKKIDEEKILRDIYIDYLVKIIELGASIEDDIPIFLEDINNNTQIGINRTVTKYDYEFYDYVLWEIFICTISVLLYYEKFKEIYTILTHSYFINISQNNDNKEFKSYIFIRKYFEFLESKCKPKTKNPNLLTLSGDILVKREKKPIITKENLSNADIVLYQLSEILELSSNQMGYYWFPLTYVYHNYTQNIWKKLKSKKYCNKILPLFGATDINELKKLISSMSKRQEVGYSNCFNKAPTILRSIKIDKIGTIN